MLDRLTEKAAESMLPRVKMPIRPDQSTTPPFFVVTSQGFIRTGFTHRLEAMESFVKFAYEPVFGTNAYIADVDGVICLGYDHMSSEIGWYGTGQWVELFSEHRLVHPGHAVDAQVGIQK